MATQIFDDDITDETARALWRTVESEPENLIAKGVLADRLDEIGHEPFLAQALRWCMRRGKYPAVVEADGFVMGVWFREGGYDGKGDQHHLPRPIFDGASGMGESASVYLAYAGVAQAIAYLQDTISY